MLGKGKQRPFRILTIDGGGMRGLYSAILLDRLNRHFSRKRNCEAIDIGKGFDLIVGTSTGALISLGLAWGTETAQIVQLYREIGPRLFQEPVPTSNSHSSVLSLVRWLMKHWNKAINRSTPLYEVMYPIFEDHCLSDLYAKRQVGICIPAVNVGTHRSLLIKTPHTEHQHRYPDYKLMDVLMAATAAPMIFPIAAVQDPDDPDTYKTLIDGALWANNPVLLGIIEALNESGVDQPIEIVSVGTCAPPGGTTLTPDDLDWGIKNWRAGTRILSLALEVQSYAYQQMADKLVGYLNRPCTVVRLPRTPASADQSRYLQMDKATPQSIQVLTTLAKADAEMIMSHVMEDPDGYLNVLYNIMMNVPEWEGEVPVPPDPI